ncbi:MAG: WYL domain-containing protein, partial [Bdellovibrio sp.]
RTEEFDLDGYIKNTHQLAHPLGTQPESLQLELKVAPGTIYHFRERKLSLDQDIVGPDPESGNYTVKATVVKTVLLIPFLLSMLEGIEVVGPEAIRLEMAEHLKKMVAHYKT